jgi:MHS family proline/betaine transporter-like MFS transporter
MLVFMATYAIKTLHIDAAHALLATTFANLVVMILTPFMGALSDRVGRRPMIGACGLLYVVLGYPLYLLVGNGTFETLLIALLIVAVIQSTYTGTIPVILAEMFPTRVRYTALSLSYGFSVAIFGGFAPFVATWLIASTGDPMSPAYVVMAAGLASVISIWSMREYMNTPLN